MSAVSRSGWADALGARLDDLHPRLRAYFSPLPAGHIGVGEGTFSRVGTPRRWLWPLLRPLHDRSVVYAGWQLSVPFRITNRLVEARTVSERTFLLPEEPWTMRDAVFVNPHGRLVDELGDAGPVAASFEITVTDGALHLTSHAIGLRWRGFRFRMPRPLSPVVKLTESFDDISQRQRVSVTIDVPLLGRIYEYAGDFRYRIEQERG